MSADVSKEAENKENSLMPDAESSYLEYDSDEFTDWSGDDDDSQNLDEDVESNFSEKRYSGDGEEQPSGFGDKNQKQFDDDEDRKNPAYVPRKGSFFEHDMRKGGAVEDCCRGSVARVKEKNCEPRRRSLWSYDHSRWEHDRFDERSQRPKSVHELVTIYGFNIRKDSRSSSHPKRFGLRSKMRTSFPDGTSNRQRGPPAISTRRAGKSRRDPLRAFIVLDDKEEQTNDSDSQSCSAAAVESNKLTANHSLDFDGIKGTNRFIEEPIICFAPKRGEKISVPGAQSSHGGAADWGGARSAEHETISSDESSRAERSVFCSEVFHRGAVSRRRKKCFAGSGRLAPAVVGSGARKRFSKNNYDYDRPHDDQVFSSNDVARDQSQSDHWKNRIPSSDRAVEAQRHHRAPFSYFREHPRNAFRGRLRAGGRARGYFRDREFPQDVRVIVMCGEGEGEGDRVGLHEAPKFAASSSSTAAVNRSSSDKTSTITHQDGIILDILPPVTCCARTRTNRSSADPPIYAVAKTGSPAVNVSGSFVDSSKNSDAMIDCHLEPRSEEEEDHHQGSKETFVCCIQTKETTEEGTLSKDLKSDISEDKGFQAVTDKRYSVQRAGIDGKARGKPFHPRFPVPPRNRIFHPNAFGNSSGSSFLPAAFILPTGPMFPGPQRHSSMPQCGPSSVGRNPAASMLNLNSSHHNPASHAHQLLALPVRVTPVPFILASSQGLSLPSSRLLRPHVASSSPPRLHLPPLSGGPSVRPGATPSPVASSADVRAHPSDPAGRASSTVPAGAVVSRPTSLFQAGPPRNTPHPKHFFRFNAKYCALLRQVPSFHQQSEQCRQSFLDPLHAAKKPHASNFTSSSSLSFGVTTTTPSALSASTTSTASVHSSPQAPPPPELVAASKLSPLATAFERGSRGDEKEPQGTRDGVPAGSGSLYEVIPRQWTQRSSQRRACPIEVRGGTVYFSSELQQFQYRCYPSASKKAGVRGYTDGNAVYFNSEGSGSSDPERPGRVKKILSIVDPKSIKDADLEDISGNDGVEAESSIKCSVEQPLESLESICTMNDAMDSISVSLGSAAIDGDGVSKEQLEGSSDKLQDSKVEADDGP